jgi:hypothetical protein
MKSENKQKSRKKIMEKLKFKKNVTMKKIEKNV